jgi:pimeloyl-ACP methyl ester carboxylesterase
VNLHLQNLKDQVLTVFVEGKMTFAILITMLCIVFGVMVDAPYEDHFFNSSGVKIRYITAGKGEPVVLIHGFGANAEYQWEPVIKDLSRDHLVIAMDVRGFGKSEKPHVTSQYGTQWTADVIRLMDHLKIKKAHIAGYSSGGMITLKLLTEHPERFLAAILGGSGGARADFPFEGMDPLLEAYEAGLTWQEVLAKFNLPLPTGEQVEPLKKAFDSKAQAAAGRSLRKLMVSDDQLKAIRVPVLAIYGSNDMVELITGIKTLVPGIQVSVIDGASHGEAPERPEFVVGIRNFLSEHHATQ